MTDFRERPSYGGVDLATLDDIIGGSEDYILIEDQRASGTSSGSLSSGAWRTRPLNTEVIDTGGLVSIASNQFTLSDAGTYRIRAWGSVYAVARNAMRLQNITDATTILNGSSSYSNTDQSAPALLEGQFTIAGAKTFELQHRVETTSGTFGFGVPSGSSFTVDHEVFTRIEIWRGSTGGGSASVIYTNASASPPGSPADGDWWMPSDGAGVVYARVSSAWVARGPLYPLTDPTIPSFAWINQGTAAISTANGVQYLSVPNVGAGHSLRVRKKAAPSTPYTVTAMARVLASAGGASEVHCGLVFRQSSDGKLHTLSWEPFAGQIWSTKWTSTTVFSAQYTTATVAVYTGALIFLRIADNGTNRICSVSMDGQDWVTLHTIGRTDFLTADEVGFYVSGSSAALGCNMTLYSWKEA